MTVACLSNVPFVRIRMSKRNAKKVVVGPHEQNADQPAGPPAPSPSPAEQADVEAGHVAEAADIASSGEGATGAASAALGSDAEQEDADAVAPEDAAADVTPSVELASLKDELLRRQADFENFRKRMNRDKEEAIKFANSALLMDLTAIIDDFERAIQSAQESEDVAALRNGLELIEKQLTGMLERRWGLSRFESVGEAFDPERHEALAREQSADHAVATVIEDYQKGFVLHGRVVRPARVRVATPPERSQEEQAAGTGDSINGPDESARNGQGA